jgi:hypothetical protein
LFYFGKYSVVPEIFALPANEPALPALEGIGEAPSVGDTPFGEAPYVGGEAPRTNNNVAQMNMGASFDALRLIHNQLEGLKKSGVECKESIGKITDKVEGLEKSIGDLSKKGVENGKVVSEVLTLLKLLLSALNSKKEEGKVDPEGGVKEGLDLAKQGVEGDGAN